MTLSSLVNQSRAMLEEQARHLLTEPERQTMGYYIQEYSDGHIGVEQLVMALFELFNTHAKVGAFTLLFIYLFRKSTLHVSLMYFLILLYLFIFTVRKIKKTIVIFGHFYQNTVVLVSVVTIKF